MSSQVASQIPDWALWVPFLSAIAGGIVTGAVTFFINKTNKEFEWKKHRKDLLIQIALEDYKQSWSFVLQKGGVMPPIEVFVLHMNTEIPGLLFL